MRTGYLDDAASDPFMPSPRPIGAAATADPVCRRRLRRLLGRLSDIGCALFETLGWVADERKRQPAIVQGVDFHLGVALLVRATRWLWALQARLRTEPLVKAPAVSAAALVTEGAADGPEHLDLWDPPYRRPYVPPKPDGCIGDLPAAAVVAQVCADLDALAVLLGDRKSAAKIAAIADAVRALLGDPPRTWTKLPRPPVMPEAPVSDDFGPAEARPAAGPAPDTG